MHQSTYIENILSYFSSMDIGNLRQHLKEYSYEATTKEVFLDELERIFESYKNSGDTHLLLYEGKCVEGTCPNCGQKGYRFVGNHSKNFMDLIFEIEGDDIKEIYQCPIFKTIIENDDLGEKAFIQINYEDQNSFVKTPEYWAKANSAKTALAEIFTTPPRQLSFEEMSYWVDKHSITDELIGSNDVFEPRMIWTPFSQIYSDLKMMRDYLSDHITEIRRAINAIDPIITEQDLIDWLVKYESIGNNFLFSLEYQFKEEGDHFKWNYQDPIHFKDDVFVDAMHFIEYFRKQHEEMLDKYTVFTHEEASILSVDRATFSLKYHLEYSKEKKDSGIHIPLYINNEIDSSDELEIERN